MLLEEKVDVLKASRGGTAYILAIAERPDVIILDILLPDLDGFEVCRQLRANPITAGIPIVFITADEASLFKALSSPECAIIFEVLRKPCSAEHLLETISAANKHREPHV